MKSEEMAAMKRQRVKTMAVRRKGVVVKIRISLGFGDLFTKCNAHVIQLVTESLESSSSMYKASSAWVAIA